MARLPVPGGDSGTWGTILNEFLSESHNADGTLKSTAVSSAIDPTLVALAAHNTNGILTQTAADTFTGRTITGTTNLITVTNGDGVAGNPTITVGSQVVRTTTAQTISGIKTFSAAPVISTITNTGTLTLPTSTDTLVGRATTDTLTNKTITDTTNNVTANGLRTASGTVSVSGATAPTTGQVLTATSGTAATWQTPATADSVIYDPSKDGTTPLEQKLMTLQSGASLSLTIENGRLRGTHQNGGGSMRSFALVSGTEWVNSEIELVLWGPSIFGPTGGSDRPQMGTIHRYGEGSGKRWGFVVWWNITFSNPNIWNLAMWGANTDGTSFNNATGAQMDALNWQERTARGIRANRFNFGSWIHDYYMTGKETEKLRWLAGTDQVNITEFSDKTRSVTLSRTASSANITFATNTLLPQDVGKRVTGTGIPAGATIATVTSATAGTLSANATTTTNGAVTLSETVADPTVFNATNQAVGNVYTRDGKVQFVAANQTAGAQDITASFLIKPVDVHRQLFPVRLSSRLIGNRLQARLARLEDPLPEWEDTTRVTTIDMVAPTNLPSGFTTAGINDIPSTAGRCGIVFAHGDNPTYMEAGLFKARKL